MDQDAALNMQVSAYHSISWRRCVCRGKRWIDATCSSSSLHQQETCAWL